MRYLKRNDHVESHYFPSKSKIRLVSLANQSVCVYPLTQEG